MASGSATVKQVISGDTIVIVGTPKGGPPPEKQLILASLIAPRVAMKSLTKEIQDEPYGWMSREHLRQLLIGKKVDFKVEFTQNNKEYGCVKLDGESVSYDLLKKGLAKLKANKNPPIAYDYDELEKCQEIAKEAKVGLWNDDPGSGQNTIREVSWAVNDVGLLKSFVERNKNKKLKGIVEYVRDGGCVRILFTEEMIYCSVLISGVQCDGFKREADESGQEKVVAEPFAAEAKFFVEFRLLNRDVEVRVESSDDYGNMYGSVYHPNGNIAILLLNNGFAKIQDWSARLTESPSKLREAMKNAQNKQLRKWMNWQGQPPLEGEKEYHAKIREVHSGDSVTVLLSDNTERRLFFASIISPKFGGKLKDDEPWSLEAKELTRKTLIGKKVKVVLEYIREPSSSSLNNALGGGGGSLPPSSSDAQKKMHSVSIYLENEKNMSEILVSHGLAKTVQHRAEDKRAENYDVLVDLEKQAAEKKLGIHALNNSDRKFGVINLLGSENTQRARAYENQLIGSTLFGIVDYIIQPGKYKIRIPSQNIYIGFGLAVISYPQTARLGVTNKSNDPFVEEAMAYVRDRILQRDVSIKIDFADKRGNFFGFLWENKKCFSIELLEQGLASISNINEAPSLLREEMTAAEQKAKAGKVRIWSLPDALENGVEQVAQKEVDETYNSVCVTHINSILDFYIQDTPNNALNNIMKQLTSYEEASLEEFTPGGLPKKGDVVLAKFTVDEQWYRARVDAINNGSNIIAKQYALVYIDFGNTESLPLTRLRRCPKDLYTDIFSPQAKLCCLSGILQPTDLEDEAAQHFHDLVEGKIFLCKVEKIDANRKLHVVLTEKEAAVSSSAGHSINDLLMRQGLARLDKCSKTKIFSRLQKEESLARKSRINVWRYGDVGDDDDNPEDYPSLSNKRAPPKSK